MSQVFRSPFLLLVGLAAITAAGLCACAAARTVPTPMIELVIALSWSIMLALWIDADCRHRRQIPCFEFGFLVAAFFPVSLPVYCFWSRGWLRGLLLLLTLGGLWLLPRLLAMVLWVLLYLVT